jgi:hypothetical protein
VSRAETMQGRGCLGTSQLLVLAPACQPAPSSSALWTVAHLDTLPCSVLSNSLHNSSQLIMTAQSIVTTPET